MKPTVKKKASAAKFEMTNTMYSAIGAGVLALVFGVTTFTYFQKSSQLERHASAISHELNELKKPKYDERTDLLTEQCENSNVACISTTTRTPNIEILKFLVNFKQYENTQYRLFMEIQHTSEVITTPFEYKCDAGDKAFYVCQDISATHPADVLRVFERSYATLTPNATYQFNLMVKPTGEQQSAAPIRMKQNNDVVVVGNDGKIIKTSIQEDDAPVKTVDKSQEEVIAGEPAQAEPPVEEGKAN